jgi:hypothetical protein
MKARKLLSITGAVAITLGATAAAATGNLMAPPPKEREPAADAGTKTPAPKEKDGEKKK